MIAVRITIFVKIEGVDGVDIRSRVLRLESQT